MINKIKLKGLITPALISVGLIAFIVVGFFVVVVPIFRPLSFKTRQVEAQELLEKIYLSELTYFSKHGCFSDNPDVIGFVPDMKRQNYTWKIIRADCSSFLARAWTNIDDDKYLDIWEITELDRWLPLHVFDDKNNSGVDIDPTSPFPTNLDEVFGK